MWRVRQSAYEQAAKDFALGNEGQYASYAGLIKKFVADSNVAAQAKGLEAALAFVENEPAAKRAAGDIVSGIVAKCLNSMKANIKVGVLCWSRSLRPTHPRLEFVHCVGPPCSMLCCQPLPDTGVGRLPDAGGD